MSLTLSKGLRVIEALAYSSEPRGLTELARSLEMNQSAVQRLLNALVAEGYARQARGTRKYELSLSLWELGMRSLEHSEVRRLLRPTLRLGMQATGFTCFFSLLVYPFVTYFVSVEGPKSQPHAAELGRRIPMTQTASGRAIFPYLPQPMRRNLGTESRDWTGFQIAPAADLDEIERITQEVRHNRYATSQSGIRKGRNSVGAAVWGEGPLPLGAVVVTATEEALPPSDFAAIGAKVVELADEATVSLGGTRFRNAAEMAPA